MDIDTPLVLVTEEGREDETVLRLARVGYEKVKGVLKNGIKDYPGKLEAVQSIQPSEMKKLIDSGIEILDVRKVTEWNISHIKGATLLSLSHFPNNLKTLDKNQHYLVHCGGGYRSMTAISIMKNHGFKNLTNVSGGFEAMQSAGLPVLSEEVPA
jgi:rhodanese-related sulfurtransferase